MDLSNSCVFVTGASRGIGEAAVRKFAQLGAQVALVARSAENINRIAEEIGSNALAIPCDVSSYQDVAEAMAQTVKQFGKLNVLVNNAGVLEPIARLEDSQPDAWGHVVDINLKGVYNCLRAAYPFMKGDGGGVIVNLSSGAAVNALEGWSHYCATKAAVLALTRCAHKEWASSGIRVIGLSPGTVATEMQVAIKVSGINPVSQLDWSDHISTEWVAEAIAWLTRDAAREYDGQDFSLRSEANRRLVGLI